MTFWHPTTTNAANATAPAADLRLASVERVMGFLLSHIRPPLVARILPEVSAVYIERELLQLLPDDCSPVVAQISISFRASAPS
jgi:hypothetical protein